MELLNQLILLIDVLLYLGLIVLTQLVELLVLLLVVMLKSHHFLLQHLHANSTFNGFMILLGRRSTASLNDIGSHHGFLCRLASHILSDNSSTVLESSLVEILEDLVLD